MTETFVDTSALYAFLVEDDDNHAAAEDALMALRAERVGLATSSFVVVETVSLLQARVGVATVRAFYFDFFPLLRVIAIDDALFHRAMHALLGASRRNISLTDWTSFTLMRELGIVRVFAFDADFVAQGFEVVPHSS
ncbi:MAG: PIN domain-containing protein [Gammaproteobacteria bacterium]|nr:PIN domain-containing protein [Gammaproteobacteria bacterium]